jgi:hypothetical protein
MMAHEAHSPEQFPTVWEVQLGTIVSVTVIGKFRGGQYHTVYAERYSEEMMEWYDGDDTIRWYLTGRDGYNADDIESWAYIPYF